MRIESCFIKGLLLVVMAGLCVPAQAGGMHSRIAEVKSSAGKMQGVVLDLEWPHGAGQGQLRLSAQRLVLPALGYEASDLRWQCPLVRAGGGWQCDGVVQVRGNSPGRMMVALSPAATRADLRLGNRRLGLESIAASPDITRISIERIPAAWLQEFLSTLWTQGRWTAGSLSGRVDIASPAKGPFGVDTDLELADIGIETPSGAIAAAALAGRLQVVYRQAANQTQVDTRFTARGGEFLAGNLYATLPKSPVALHLLARQHGTQPWELPVLQWSDPGVLSVDGRAILNAQSLPDLLALNVVAADLSVARDRYLSGFLAPAGFADLALDGQLDAHMQMNQGAVNSLLATLKNVNAIDRQGRFVLAGVAGDLAWNAGEGPVASRIGWHNGALFGIGLGPGSFPFASQNGELRLLQPAAIDVLGGHLSLNHLNWQAPAGEHGATFDFGVAVDKLDLASLSQRLGWPAFTGSIDGRIPSAHFRDNVLNLDGGLEMDLFNGRLRLDGLSMERPFGVAPTLSADVAIEDIDLEPMTKVFGFGSITGRLDGHINHLRLVDWAPVAFDAHLQTDKQWKGRRRISQRAVNDISSVGGSGLIAGLQAKVLGFFDDFGYEQIGLGCLLKDNVCRMEGIGSAGDGYIIVAGAGLPRIQVVGFRRRVDWPTLVARLNAATQGQAPVIQ
jgi:hypothetical protein